MTRSSRNTRTQEQFKFTYISRHNNQDRYYYYYYYYCYYTKKITITGFECAVPAGVRYGGEGDGREGGRGPAPAPVRHGGRLCVCVCVCVFRMRGAAIAPFLPHTFTPFPLIKPVPGRDTSRTLPPSVNPCTLISFCPPPPPP